MKKICLVLVFGMLMTVSSFAQTPFKPFKVDLSLGYAMVGGSGAKGGILFAVEPKYAVLNSLSVGLRMEGAVIARFSGYDDQGNALNASVKAAGSYVATGDYYLTSKYAFRPFVGAGVGLFSIAAGEADGSGERISGGMKFGGLIRGGLELAHLRLGLEYNIIPSTDFHGFDSNGDLTTLKSKNGYIGIKLGVCIGGGPRR